MMNEDMKILKTIVKICHNYLQKGEEIDFVILENQLYLIMREIYRLLKMY